MSVARPPDCDVLIVGGGLAGGSLATHLLRERPGTRVTVVEAQSTFPRKLGEATVEISALFLREVLGLGDVLARDHLPKHGLRFWFDRGEGGLDELAELGPSSTPMRDSYQLDRARLDDTVLDLARKAGAEVLRPARVREVELSSGSEPSRVVVDQDGEEHSLAATWVIDATGRQGFLARRLDLRRRFDAHPTASQWGHFRGVTDLDTRGLAHVEPALRRLGTNHFCGHGRWCWMIPMADGTTSVGLVYDTRLFELPGSGSLEPRFEAWARGAPGLRDLLEDAELVDFGSLAHLAYRAERYAGPGWALVGDAAAFLDPLYSPGLDHLAFSVLATCALLRDQLDGRGDAQAAIEAHNAAFERSYARLFSALYEDKYELLGDAELWAATYWFDTSFYFLGVVRAALNEDDGFLHPAFGKRHPLASAAHATLSRFRSRLVTLARRRQALGIYGRRNADLRDLRYRFDTEAHAGTGIARALGYWLRAEGVDARTRLARLFGAGERRVLPAR